mmetsp:Transcript_22286/g.48996  ORF Transcript_22286/g.48996 Transcript_22286/m.48996 type:complete len:317 (-) Transcript_22286:123-1073(-)
MPMRVRVLSAEHGSNLEHPLQIGADSHLLVKLRRLGEAARAQVHVLEPEHRRSTLGCTPNHLGAVNLRETLAEERAAEQLAHRRLNPENRVVRRRTQIKNAIVQTRVLSHPDELRVRLKIPLGPRSVLKGERQAWLRLRHGVESGHLNLNILLCATLDGRLGLGNHTLDVHDGLLGDVRNVLDHPLAHGLLVHKQCALHGRHALPQNHERGLALRAAVVEPSPDEHRAAHLVLSEICNPRPLTPGNFHGLHHPQVAILVLQGVILLRCGFLGRSCRNLGGLFRLEGLLLLLRLELLQLGLAQFPLAALDRETRKLL